MNATNYEAGYRLFVAWMDKEWPLLSLGSLHAIKMHRAWNAAIASQPAPAALTVYRCDFCGSDYTDAKFCCQQRREYLNGYGQYETKATQPPAPQSAPAGESFQNRVAPWMQECFGAAIASDVRERGDRLLEETLELLQSHGYDPTRVLTLRDYVFNRPVGEPFQEVGGVMVTLAAYCLATGINMHEAGETELARIWTKIARIREKQASKRDIHSPLPTDAPAPQSTGAGVGELALRLLGSLESCCIEAFAHESWKAASIAIGQHVPLLRAVIVDITTPPADAVAVDDAMARAVCIQYETTVHGSVSFQPFPATVAAMKRALIEALNPAEGGK